MAMTPEAKVKKVIKDWLKTLPYCWWFMPIGGAYTSHGVPDIVGVINGRFFAIEVKAAGKIKNTTRLQEITIAAIKAAGGVTIVADDLGIVQAAFARYGLI